MPDNFLADNGKPECDQYLVGVWALVEMPYQATLHEKAEGQHDRNGNEDGQGYCEVDNGCSHDRKLGLQYRHLLVGLEQGDAFVPDLGRNGQHLAQRDRAECTDHEDGTMREVDDTQGTEYQRQTQGNQGIGAPFVQAIE